MLVYVIPYLDKPGGIQQFAKSIYAGLREDYEIEIVNWQRSIDTLQILDELDTE